MYVPIMPNDWMTTSLDGDRPLTQTDLMDTLLTAQRPPDEVCTFKRVLPRPSRNRVLCNMSGLQRNVMVALVGCVDVNGYMGNISRATKHALLAKYGIADDVLILWMKNCVNQGQRGVRKPRGPPKGSARAPAPLQLQTPLPLQLRTLQPMQLQTPLSLSLSPLPPPLSPPPPPPPQPQQAHPPPPQQQARFHRPHEEDPAVARPLWTVTSCVPRTEMQKFMAQVVRADRMAADAAANAAAARDALVAKLNHDVAARIARDAKRASYLEEKDLEDAADEAAATALLALGAS